MRAVGRLTAGGRRVRYRIIGDGPERARLEALIAELGLGESVQLLGWRTHTEMARLLASAHIFVAPCQTAADGNQDAPVNTLKEAMATGLPVVATRHGGIPELVEHGVSGWLTPERDAPALAAALDRLLEDPDGWPTMAVAGRAAVERLYAMDRLNDELAALYRRLVSTGRGPAPLLEFAPS
ncbi:MAG: glycosyltransferase [Pseudomonadota bacterium]